MLKIKIDGTKMVILEQNKDLSYDLCRNPFHASNGLKISSYYVPEAYYDSNDQLSTIYLRGSNYNYEKRPLYFHNVEGMHRCIQALTEFCKERNIEFVIEPRVRKLC